MKTWEGVLTLSNSFAAIPRRIKALSPSVIPTSRRKGMINAHMKNKPQLTFQIAFAAIRKGMDVEKATRLLNRSTSQKINAHIEQTYLPDLVCSHPQAYGRRKSDSTFGQVHECVPLRDAQRRVHLQGGRQAGTCPVRGPRGAI
jgi:hypothetical protein